jgi:hypothetical protein
MKHIQLLVVLAFACMVTPSISVAREQPLTEEEATIVQVYEAPGYTKDQIYDSTKMWIAQKFKSAKAVTEYDNKEEGILIGNGIIPYTCAKGFAGGMECAMKSDWTVPFTMKVEAKDGKFRLTFTNIHLAWPAAYRSGISTPAHDGPVWQRKELEKIRPRLLEFGNDINASMGKLKASDDW